MRIPDLADAQRYGRIDSGVEVGIRVPDILENALQAVDGRLQHLHPNGPHFLQNQKRRHLRVRYQFTSVAQNLARAAKSGLQKRRRSNLKRFVDLATVGDQNDLSIGINDLVRAVTRDQRCKLVIVLDPANLFEVAPLPAQRDMIAQAVTFLPIVSSWPMPRTATP